MNVEDLQLVTRSNTANIVLRHFIQRERAGNETTLDAFKSYLIRNKSEINPDDFQKIFIELEEAGVGELVEYHGNKRGKFKWYYSLKDIAEQVLNPNKKIEIRSIDQTEIINKKKPRGRPVGYSPKAKRIVTREKPSISDIPRRPKVDYTNLVFLFTTDSGESLAFRISEAERLAKQVDLIKSKLG